MAKKTTGQIAPQPNGQAIQIVTMDQRVQQVRTMVERNRLEIERALAKRISVDLFVRICLTTYRAGGERMCQADPRSFIGACVECAQLGLLPEGHLGEAYLVPVWDKNLRLPGGQKGGYVVDLRLGYPGLMKLARRGGEVKDIQAEVVCANDEFSVTLGTDRRIYHVPWYCAVRRPTEPGPIIAAYATAEIAGSNQLAFQVVSKHELDRAAAKSGSPKDDQPSNVWRDYPDAMSRKTAVRRLCKWLPVPDEARQAMNRDEALDEGKRDAIETRASEPGPPQTLDDLLGEPEPSSDGIPPDEWIEPDDVDKT